MAVSTFITSLAALAAAGPQDRAVADAIRAESPIGESCRTNDADAIVVCGRQTSPYRIDPVILDAQRMRDAVPDKPDEVAGAAAGTTSCVGHDSCGAGIVPLVGVALAAAKAAVLAAQGEDWRDAFRTRPDAYKGYQDAKSRKVRVGFSAAPPPRRP